MRQRPPICGAAVALCLAFAHPAGATPSAVLYTGVHGGGGRNLHTVEVLAPILRRGGNLWFADLRGATSSANTQEYNLGFGLRHLVTRRGVLGAYAYYDHRRAYGHFFDQATVGMEWLGRRFDLRANVYLPFGPPRFLGTSAPYLAETGVAINRDYAEALHGFDLEGGLLVPGISRYVETRAYAGIYRFFGTYNKNVSGWRARVEFWLTRGVYAEVDRRDDNLQGPQTIASLNLYVPLNRHFLRNLADVFNPRPNAVRTLRERMLQPPIRDVDIHSAAYAQAQVIQPLLYVDPAASGAGIGTLSRPIIDLQTAIDTAGPGTWVRIGSGTYAGSITVPADVTLWGAGTSAFGIPAGRTPVIHSPGPADAVTITSPLQGANPLQGAQPAAVMGLAATGADANHAGFRITGSGVTLIADRTYGNGIGIAVDHTGTGAQSVSIRDTLAYRNTWFGLQARNAAGAGTQSLDVSGSTFTANGLGGIWADNQAGDAQIVDLGGGGLGSAGGNRIFANTVYDLADDSGGALSARDDWWGQPGGPQTFAYAAPGGLTAGTDAVTDTSGALPADPGTFTATPVQSPLVFVDDARAGSVRDGTYAHPYAGVQNAVNAAGPGTWVRIGSGTYAGSITVPADVTLWGAGTSAFGIPASRTPVIRSPGPADAVTITSPLPGTTPLQGANPAAVMGLAATGADADHAGFRIIGSGVSLIADRTYGNGIGIAVDHTGAGAQSVSIRDTLAYRNTWFGLQARNAAGAGTQSLAVSGSTFTANGLGGIWADNQAGDAQIVDLGGGGLGSAGGNRIFANTVYDLANDSGGALSARGDWWGQPGGPQTFAYAAPGGLTAGTGAVTDTSGALSTDPGTFTATPIQSPLVFVDDTRAGTVRDGTYAHPYAGVQNAVNTARPGGTVFVAPGASVYTGNITMTPGSTLWGAGYRDLGIGGASRPALTAASGTVVTAATDTTLRGFSISSHTLDLAIDDVSHVLVARNHFSAIGWSRAIDLRALSENVTDIQILDNRFQGGGFQVSAESSPGFSSNFTETSNRFQGGLFSLYASGSGSMLFGRNTFSSSIGVYLSGRWTADFGGGALGGTGGNRFLQSWGYSMGAYGSTVYAKQNWWGQASGPAPNRVFGSVEVSPWLLADPGP